MVLFEEEVAVKVAYPENNLVKLLMEYMVKMCLE